MAELLLDSQIHRKEKVPRTHEVPRLLVTVNQFWLLPFKESTVPRELTVLFSKALPEKSADSKIW